VSRDRSEMLLATVCAAPAEGGGERGRLDASPIFLPLPGGAGNSFVDSVDFEIPSRFLALGTTRGSSRGWTFPRIRLERKKKKKETESHASSERRVNRLSSIDARERKTSSRSPLFLRPLTLQRRVVDVVIAGSAIIARDHCDRNSISHARCSDRKRAFIRNT